MEGVDALRSELHLLTRSSAQPRLEWVELLTAVIWLGLCLSTEGLYLIGDGDTAGAPKQLEVVAMVFE
jgi:hypothetical protein